MILILVVFLLKKYGSFNRIRKFIKGCNEKKLKDEIDKLKSELQELKNMFQKD